MIYRWGCEKCYVTTEISRPMAECTVPPDSEIVCLCSDSKPTWTRIYEAPMVMKASYPDGMKRKGWAELKESAKLEKLAATSKRETKAEIKNEIRKMGIKPGKD